VDPFSFLRPVFGFFTLNKGWGSFSRLNILRKARSSPFPVFFLLPHSEPTIFCSFSVAGFFSGNDLCTSFSCLWNRFLPPQDLKTSPHVFHCCITSTNRCLFHFFFSQPSLYPQTPLTTPQGPTLGRWIFNCFLSPRWAGAAFSTLLPTLVDFGAVGPSFFWVLCF